MKHEVTTYNTKRLLAQSLKTAMAHKPFSKITVSELIRDCGVNRKTFYYHFQDIYDLLKWVLEEEAFQVVKHFDLLLDHKAAIRFVMDYVEQNDYIISCVYDSIGREEMKRFLYADCIHIVTAAISEAEEQANTQLDPAFKAYVSQFYTEAIASMLIQWAKDRKRQDREQTIRYLTSIIGTAIESMMAKMTT